MFLYSNNSCLWSHFAVRENGDDCWCQLAKEKNNTQRSMLRDCWRKQQQQNQNNFQKKEEGKWKNGSVLFFSSSCHVVKGKMRKIFLETYTSSENERRRSTEKSVRT